MVVIHPSTLSMMLETSRTLVFLLGYFIIAVSLIPLIRNDNWIFRIFEYPRAQKLLLAVVLLVIHIVIADWEDTHSLVFTLLLAADAFYLFYQIFPYTVLAKRQMKGQRTIIKDKHFKLLVCNVYQENRNAARCLSCIRDNNPDLIILVETD